MLLLTFSLAQGTYGYGNIDMHGGKTDSLTGQKDKKTDNFNNKNMGMSSFLNKNPNNKENKKSKQTNIKNRGQK